MRSVIVLGAGMVGVSTALHLQRRGWSVVLVDRKPPGRETSYGNAGFIQSEAVRPYPMPRDLSTLAAIATGRANDVHYGVTSAAAASRSLAALLVAFRAGSAPAHFAGLRAASSHKATSEHDVLIREAGADNLVQRSGYHSLRRTQAALDEVALVAETLAAEFGVRSEIISPAQLAAAEPGLNETGAGAIHWRDPWTVSDPGGLVSAYADLFTRAGGTFVNGDAATLAPTSAGWTVQSNDGPIDAEAAVVSLGPWSPDLLQKFGYRFPMLRKRGYHRHFSGGGRLNLPLHDPEFGYAMAPMAKGLRITSGAELMGP